MDKTGTEDSLDYNMEMEFKRNKERYAFFKWAQNTFDNLNIIPPGVGIIHQVNLEYLAKVVMTTEKDGKNICIHRYCTGDRFTYTYDQWSWEYLDGVSEV